MGFLQLLYDILHRGRSLGDEKLPSPGFPGEQQRVPGYSLLASSRVLAPQILARIKVLLALVTSIDKESLYSRVPAFFLNGVHLYCRPSFHYPPLPLKTTAMHDNEYTSRPAPPAH
ncbi:unnamed protein product [Laminaria digitata]